jgi:hypothetical protein
MALAANAKIHAKEPVPAESQGWMQMRTPTVVALLAAALRSALLHQSHYRGRVPRPAGRLAALRTAGEAVPPPVDRTASI